MGRLLEARVTLGDRVGARNTAQAYLRQFPKGAHAEEAKRVLETTP
jgi:hypothetical protein